MVTDFIDAVRLCFSSNGYMRTENGIETGGIFLVGCANRLFCVDSDFQVAESKWDYAAIGCGEEYALGTLHHITNQKGSSGINPKDAITFALQAAECHSAGVR